MISESTVPVVQRGPSKIGLALSAKVYAGRWGSLGKRSPRRWSLEKLIQVCLFVARRAYASAPKRKNKVQVDGRSWGLCWQLAKVCCATCWLSTEQTSLLGWAWAVPLRIGLCDTAGTELMRSKADTRSVLRRAVSSARSWKVPSVWYVPGDKQEGPEAKTRSVL